MTADREDAPPRLLRALQATLDHEIPITRPLGITVAEYDGATLALRAPLQPNLNHKATAFAGSLNALVTLAGWGLVWLLLQEHAIAGTIVIQESTTHYRLPVREDFVARCHTPAPDDVALFVAALQRRGKARIALTVTIQSGEQVAVSFTARYVVHRNP